MKKLLPIIFTLLIAPAVFAGHVPSDGPVKAQLKESLERYANPTPKQMLAQMDQRLESYKDFIIDQQIIEDEEIASQYEKLQNISMDFEGKSKRHNAIYQKGRAKYAKQFPHLKGAILKAMAEVMEDYGDNFDFEIFWEGVRELLAIPEYLTPAALAE